MLYAGKNIQSSSDSLTALTEERLYNSLRNPKSDISSHIKLLRSIQAIDNKKYSQLKRQLPYFVCACFNPPYRKTENFAYTDCFIMDIDHIALMGTDVETIANKLKTDSRIVMMFTSPGGDGLKILFHLKERCYDPGLYSIFYKRFVKSFSVFHNIEQAVDSVTCDVSRACFISMDENAYYNPTADVVDMNAYIDDRNTESIFDLKRTQDREEKETSSVIPSSDDVVRDPDKETMNRIRSMLNEKKAKMHERNNIFIPEKLDEIIDNLKAFIEDQGIDVYEIINIQYAKKIRCKLGAKFAEVNLFYGKRGFNVVQSPRTGTSLELNSMVAEIINIYLYDITF